MQKGQLASLKLLFELKKFRILNFQLEISEVSLLFFHCFALKGFSFIIAAIVSFTAVSIKAITSSAY